jgi:hypothetical protein
LISDCSQIEKKQEKEVKTSLAFTFKKINYLESKSKYFFLDGLRKYMLGSNEDKEEFHMFYALFKELAEKGADLK